MKTILKLLVGFLLLGNTSLVLAASIDHFEVTVNPERISIGEAVDLEIDAVDKDNNVITDYEGTILIFSESDKEAEFPNSLEDNSFTFQKSNEGHVKFENAVRFQNQGKNDIHVYDLSDETDSIMGLAEVEVLETIEDQNVEIIILSPENGLTIGANDITVSGTTKKNHQVKIILNGKNEILTTSNKDGVFEKKIEDLPNGESVIKAYVLDGDEKEIGMSKEIHITSDSSKPGFNKIILNPSGKIEVEKNIFAEVYATKGLDEVSIIFNEGINILTEDEPGIYKGEFLAPKEIGEYPVDVILKDDLGHKTKEIGAETVSTIAKSDTGGVVDDNIDDDIDDDVDLGAGTKQKKDKCINGDYSGSVFDGKCGTKDVDYGAAIDLGIKNLKIVELKTKSVLTWDRLEDATKYEVYKKLIGDELELIDVVTEPKYEILITGEEIKYEFFAVKAVGKKKFTDTDNQGGTIEKEISGDLSEAIKIQTGPKEIIIVLLALLLTFGVFIVNKKRRSV